jgi:peptidoglycan/LPS O-acetylase OafA/YrhL
MTGPERPHKLALLDGMRGFAALIVVLFHMRSQLGLSLPDGPDRVKSIILDHAYLAVDLFFILSGFVICRAYDGKLASGVFSRRDFVVVRLIRLYPLYVLSCMLVVATTVLQKVIGRGEFAQTGYGELAPAMALTVLFVPMQVSASGYLFAFNRPAWSLFYELLANLAYALCHPWLSLRNLGVVLVACFAAMVVCALSTNTIALAGVVWDPTQLAYGLARAIFGIAYGIFLQKSQPRWEPVAARWAMHGAVPLIVVAAVLIGAPHLDRGNGVIDLAAIAVILPAAVMLSSVATIGKRLARLCLFGGATSYAFYVLHWPALLFSRSIGAQHGIVMLLFLGGFLACVLTACYVIDLVYDQPVRAWLTRRYFTDKSTTGPG